MKEDYRHIVRIADTDLDGSKPIGHSLNKIKGVSFMFANAVCTFSRIDKKKITGQLNADEVKRLNEILKEPSKYGFPVWMLNRRKYAETGENRHIIGADLKWQVENDIKLMKKIRSYKGVRHMLGLPVRGQKTKNNFRKKKGKGLGVKRKKTAAPAAKGGK
ncbi:MAG: 30S ribosomal protein S13 [Nanoarchaeota archaeon]|nr:30S ribosomal protein S13 [Nanoarchaeota archaeon]